MQEALKELFEKQDKLLSIFSLSIEFTKAFVVDFYKIKEEVFIPTFLKNICTSNNEMLFHLYYMFYV